MYFKLLWGEFATLPEVVAIALGGSRAGADYDEKSDYDLYIYCTSIPEGIKIIQGKSKHNKKRFPIPGAFLQHVFGDLIPLIC